ncbi:MAG TPA: XDD3 family exosortase-dependent surface protein [Kamptonema sp.]|nr:XDD3 family exosortase-dependent surface protein [Kamptonema sp.]
MKIRNLSTLLGVTAAAVCVGLVTGQAAKAGTLGPDWTYTMDSFTDGHDGNIGVGKNSNYEMYGMAMRAKDGIISIAFNANLALAGQADSAADGNIGWGDVLFNFTGKSLKDASATGSLFGIRFAGSNDSGVAGTGVFSGVTAKSVASDNSGYKTFSQYQNDVNNSSPNTNTGTTGGQIGYGGVTVPEAKSYLTDVNGVSQDTDYGQLNVIKTGTKVGDISFLGASEIASLASGFAGLGGIGKYTVGFSFSETLLGKFLQPANAVITLLEECTNDGMIVKATLPSVPDSEPVPEPITIVGMALGGLGLVKGKINQRRAARANVTA